MKKILAILLATVSMSVAADTWRAKNDGGGEIVLTKTQCADPAMPNMLAGYSYHRSGLLMLFCYTIIETDVIAVYLEDGDIVRYSASMFYQK